jgi:hypothetical protein
MRLADGFVVLGNYDTPVDPIVDLARQLVTGS